MLLLFMTQFILHPRANCYKMCSFLLFVSKVYGKVQKKFVQNV